MKYKNNVIKKKLFLKKKSAIKNYLLIKKIFIIVY